MTVSYTHLDVYKRQAIEKNLHTDTQTDTQTHTPVSYTHLDVYKRQINL